MADATGRRMRLAIIYATREGQTRKVAEHVSGTLAARGHDVDTVDARAVGDAFSLAGFDGVLLAASVHLGKHEKELVRFVQRHRDALAALPCAFLSVSGSAATAAAPTATPEVRARAAAEADAVLARFYNETGWTPMRALPVAGAMLYSKYNFLVRFVMRGIAKRNGAVLATSGDHEYTDWDALDSFVASFAALVEQQRPMPEAHVSG